MTPDTRYRRIASHLDDLRTELADIEEEGPPQLHHLYEAHSQINNAIRSMQYAQGICGVCSGVGKVRQAVKTEVGFDWLAGDSIDCPACGGSA